MRAVDESLMAFRDYRIVTMVKEDPLTMIHSVSITLMVRISPLYTSFLSLFIRFQMPDLDRVTRVWFGPLYIIVNASSGTARCQFFLVKTSSPIFTRKNFLANIYSPKLPRQQSRRPKMVDQQHTPNDEVPFRGLFPTKCIWKAIDLHYRLTWGIRDDHFRFVRKPLWAGLMINDWELIRG